ncbi:MAG: hypothetical protein V1659_00260 [Candidatus Woesearchaeota archaeon]
MVSNQEVNQMGLEEVMDTEKIDKKAGREAAKQEEEKKYYN